MRGSSETFGWVLMAFGGCSLTGSKTRSVPREKGELFPGKQFGNSLEAHLKGWRTGLRRGADGRRAGVLLGLLLALRGRLLLLGLPFGPSNKRSCRVGALEVETFDCFESRPPCAKDHF